jgi:hypothetical protein
LNLNYAIWNQFQIRFVYDEQTSVYQGASWTDARNEIRRILESDFLKYGTVSDGFGNLFLINGAEINTLAYSNSTFHLLVTFKNESTLLVRCVTSEIGQQHYKYLKFLSASNNLSQLMRNRNVKVIAQGATAGSTLFPTFETLSPNLSEGDFIIVTPGTYQMVESFTLKNGVDIWIQGATIDVQYTAAGSVQWGVFTDIINPELYSDLNNDTRAEFADTTKRKQARIFGNADFNIFDCPANRFMPLIRNYYNSELYATAESYESNNSNSAVMYSFNGALTARVKTITAQRLIDNDYLSAVCDLDSLTATISGNTFFPGTDVSMINPLGIVRNCNITNDNGLAIDTIAQSEFIYHYINCIDSGSSTFLYDIFANSGCAIYAHNFKLETDKFTEGTFDSTFYNNHFNNYSNNSDTSRVAIIEDSLTFN